MNENRIDVQRRDSLKLEPLAVASIALAEPEMLVEVDAIAIIPETR